MKKTSTCQPLTKLKSIQSKAFIKSSTDLPSSLHPKDIKNINTQNVDSFNEIIKQGQSTTFTSKIFQSSNCNEKVFSDLNSPTKSKSSMESPKKKISVTSSSKRVCTQNSLPYHKLITSVMHSFKPIESTKCSYPYCEFSDRKNQKCVTEQNPQIFFNQKEKILKRLGGKQIIKNKEQSSFSVQNKLFLNQPYIDENQQIQEKQETYYQREHERIFQSQKKPIQIKKKILQVIVQKNQANGKILKQNSNESWIMLRQNDGQQNSKNHQGIIDTPINKLFQEVDQTKKDKPRFFKHV